MAKDEEFEKYDTQRYQVIKNVAKSKGGKNGCVYGNTIVNNGKYEWEIKYESTDGDRCCGRIGIATHTDYLNQNSVENKATTICYYHNKATAKSQVNLTGTKKVSVIQIIPLLL